MIKTFVNAWKVPELRKKMIFTIFIVVIYRIGSAVPVPFVNIIDNIIDANNQTFLNYISMIAGSAFGYGTIFAMGVTPYINSSIIIQLLTVAIPALERLSKEGEEGRKKIQSITRYVTIGLAVLQSTAYFIYLRSEGYILQTAEGNNYGGFFGVLQGITVVLCLTAGASLVMWLGEQINDKGIGNGISIILFAGILSRLPYTVYALWSYFKMGSDASAYYAIVPVIVILLIAMVAYIVWMDNAERRIPVQYAKRVVGRKMYGGQSTHIPIKVNMSGVLPVIFASSILSIPSTVQMFLSEDKQDAAIFRWFSADHWFYAIVYFVLILFFAYFYASIQYNPIEMANNIRKNSGMIPGIRPGKPTSDYIQKILSRMVLLGALTLSVVALFPNVMTLFTTLIQHPVAISLGGTSLIILVGVALETVKQLESQMMMRHYKGFLD